MHNTQTLLSVDHTSDAIVPMNIVDLSNQNNMRSDFRYSDNNLSQGRAGHNSMLYNTAPANNHVTVNYKQTGQLSEILPH